MLSFSKIGYVNLPSTSNPITPFERFLVALDRQMQTPNAYGWFHLLFLFLTITACVLVCLTCQNVKEKRIKQVLLTTAVCLLLLEIYKQLHYSYDSSTGTWAYDWSIFPFQFCSTPMYVMLFSAFCQRKKVSSALYCFLSTYALFAGLLVMVYPNTVFTQTVGINIQTMLHHGAMVVIGVFLYASGAVTADKKTVTIGAPVFVVVLFLALVLNALHASFGDPNVNFNMFYIAKTGKMPVSLLENLFQLIPYPLILIVYSGGFTALGWLISIIAKGIQTFVRQRRKKHTIQEELTVSTQPTQGEESEELATIKETL